MCNVYINMYNNMYINNKLIPVTRTSALFDKRIKNTISFKIIFFTIQHQSVTLLHDGYESAKRFSREQ